MTRLVLSALLFFTFSPSAYAANCYFLIGYGSGEYRRSYTEKFEDRILSKSYVDGSYKVDLRSHPYEIGGGCNLNRFLAVEVDYFQGFHTEVVTTAALCTSVTGERICSGRGLMRRRTTLDGWEFSLLGKLPVSQRVSLTGRIGMLIGVARMTVTFPQLSEPIGLSHEKRGRLPLVGVGILYQANPDFSLAYEHRRFSIDSPINQVVARWGF